MKINRVITLCSSAAFYKDVVALAEQLRHRGFIVKIPDAAEEMQKRNDYVVENYKTWFSDPNDYQKKRKLMIDHFTKVAESDCVLVVNQTKHGVTGYIGGNVLMEMAIAFHYTKPLFLLNDVSKESPFLEEILGMQPTFIDGDLDRIQ